MDPSSPRNGAEFNALQSPATHTTATAAAPHGTVAVTHGGATSTYTFADASTSRSSVSSLSTFSDPAKPTSTPSSSSSSWCSRTCCCGAPTSIILLRVLLIVSLIFIIAGAIIPTIVHRVLDDAINKGVQINPSTMSSKSWNTFNNDSMSSRWFVYNVTNLRDVLLTGTVLPNVVPIEVPTNKWMPKYEVTFNSDGTRVSYYEPRWYEPVEQGPAMLDQYVTVVNPVYLGAIAQVNRQMQLAAAGTVKGQFSDLDELTFHNVVLAASMLPGFSTQLQTASSSLISALRFFSIPVYMQTCFSYLNTTDGLSQARVVAVWTRTDTSITLRAPCDGFVLPQSLDIVKSASLLSTTAANSLIARAGVLTWMNAISVNTSAAIAPLLVNNFTATDYNNVCDWMLALMASANFRMAAIDIGFQSRLGPNLVPSGSTFNDLGYLQFGSGAVVSILTAGASTSVVDVIGPSAGYLASVNVRKPAEIRVGAIDFCSRPEYAQLVVCRSMSQSSAPVLTISQTRAFFSFASNQTTNTVTLSRVLSSLFSTATTFNVTMAQAFAGYNASAPATVRPILALPFFGTAGANSDLLFAYVNGYITHVFTGYLSEMDENGIGPANSGLFIRLTLREVLFGMNKAGTQKVTALAAWSNLLDGEPLPSTKSWDTLFAQYKQTNPGRITTAYTCQDTRDNCGKVVTYLGTPRFKQSCEINDPMSTGACAPTSATRLYNNYTMWNEYEVIDGSNDVFATPPLKSDSDALQVVRIYVNEVRRIVSLPLNGEKPDVKGVKTRRYKVDPRHFFTNYDGFNATTNPLRDTYRYMTADAPDGMVHTWAAVGGVPLSVCLPRFNLVSSNETAKLTGFTSDPNDDITFLDVEPLTGKTFRGARRLQANMLLRKSNFSPLNAMHANLFKAVGGDHVYMPYYYLNETKIISDSDASDFKDTVILALDVGSALQIALLVVGCVFFVASVAALYVFSRRLATAGAAKSAASSSTWSLGKSTTELQSVPA